MTWGLVAAAGATVVGAVVSSSAAKKAAKATTQAADTASQTELEMYYQGREDMAPWRKAGEQALNKLIPMVEKGPGEFVPENEPGYKFGYEEFVEKPTLRLASATGRLGSGATGKALTRYASDYASTKYENFLDRWYKSLTPFQSLAGIGQTTATQGAQVGQQTGAQVGQNILAAGNANATSYINQGNIWSNAASGISQNALDYAMYKNLGLIT